MLKKIINFKQVKFGLAAVLLTLPILAPILLTHTSKASAAQVTARSITMSTSQSSTAATYTITFTPVTTTQELIVDFCSNDPLYNDTCSFATTTVPTIASPTSNLGTAASVGSGTPVHTVKVTGLTMTGGSAYTIKFTAGVTNPTTNTSFYARILTYATGNASGYTPANTSGNTPTLGTFVDYGGIALSTAANISITSKVFETLTFCIFQTSCGTAPTLTLGDPTTGALSTANAYINTNAQYTLSTNAASGIAVTMTGQTLCRITPLNFANCPTGASANTITAIGTTAAVVASGTEQFGMCVDKTGSSALTIAAAYADAINACHGLSTGTYSGTSKFGFDDTNSTGTNSAAGSTVITSSGAVPTVTNPIVFEGSIAVTTEAGVYQSTLNMVATGTF